MSLTSGQRDFIGEIQEKKVERGKEQFLKKYALVCWHLVLPYEKGRKEKPEKQNAVVFPPGEVVHERHDGTIWCCEPCALNWSKMSLEEVKNTFLMREQKEFYRNINKWIEA